MMARPAIFPPLLALAALLFAGPALAQPPPAQPATPLAIARCIWDALPSTTRAALIASGPSIDDIGKAIGAMNPALMELAQSQCPSAASQADEEAAKDAWAGVVMTKWSEGELAARYHVTPAALTRAWARLPAAPRAEIAAGFDKTPEAARPAVAPFAAQLGLTDPPALDLLSAWAIAQVRLAALN
jgi:hypothetical protein